MMRFEKLAEIAGIDAQKIEDRVDGDFSQKLHKFYKLVMADCINPGPINTVKHKPTPLNKLYELDTEG